MAYSKKTWTNRTSEYPNRYRMTSANGNIADVAIVPNEGNVTAEGDKFSADTMNNLETRIKNGFDSADSSISALNTTLRGLISNEQTRAVGVETLIQANVDALESNLASEVSRARSAETTLTNNLASEVSRATGVENGHNTRITSLEGRMENAESDIGTLESAIAGFQTSLDTEVTRATGAESTLTTNLQAETTRATNAENVLDTRVTTLETITTRAYKASGSVYFADLPLAVESRQGNIYDILDAFTTTDDFLEGPGKEYPAHTDVVIVGVEGDYYNEVTPSGEENPSEEGWYVYDSTEEEYVLTEDTSVQSGTTYYSYANVKYMYNIGIGFFDTSNFVQKTDYATLLAAGIVKPDGTTTTIDANGVLSALGGGQGSAEAAERMIAPIEADATASTRAYAVGAKLILNEVLYKAKTAIEIGDELVIGTNIEASDDVSTQIDDANAELQKSYKTDDSASTTINDTDYVPMSESDGTKKKTLWSTIVSKIKSALGIESSGSTYLKKDGTWGTPTNTTYTFATGDNNGQIKVTPSGGSAQNVSVKGLGSAAYDNTVPISHGGTGATTRLGAAKNLTNESVTSPQYVVGLTNNHANFGYTTLANLKTAMGTFPPSSHASTGTGYGVGNASNYGHVKLSDEYKSSVGAAANSIGASQSAVYSLGTWHGYAGYVVLSIQNVNSSVDIEGKGYGANAMLYAHASFNSHLVHLKFSMGVKAKINHNTRLFTLNLSQYVYNDNNYSKILYAQNMESVIGQIEFRNTGMSNVDSFDVYSAGGVKAGDYINVEATFIRAPKFSSNGS